jgi:hypothetical protein
VIGDEDEEAFVTVPLRQRLMKCLLNPGPWKELVFWGNSLREYHCTFLYEKAASRIIRMPATGTNDVPLLFSRRTPIDHKR